MYLRISILAVLTLQVLSAEEDHVGTGRDSYVDAYQVTHGLNQHKDGRAEKEPHPVYKPVEEFHGPPKNYGPPKDVYGPPKDAYGPPKDLYDPPKVYGPPQNSYGPPLSFYGPPQGVLPKVTDTYSTFYGPPVTIYGPTEENHGMRQSVLSIWDKLKFKLDLFTVGKIILKLVIFKKVVSLIAILCLLLFIPTLKHKVYASHHVNNHVNNNNNHNNYHYEEEDDDDDERRSFKNNSVDDTLNNLTTFVKDSIDKMGRKYDKESESCDSIYCKARGIIGYINEKLSNSKLINLYIQEKR